MKVTIIEPGAFTSGVQSPLKSTAAMPEYAELKHSTKSSFTLEVQRVCWGVRHLTLSPWNRLVGGTARHLQGDARCKPAAHLKNVADTGPNLEAVACKI